MPVVQSVMMTMEIFRIHMKRFLTAMRRRKKPMLIFTKPMAEMYRIVARAWYWGIVSGEIDVVDKKDKVLTYFDSLDLILVG
jgi:hypothetical protein